MELKQIRLVLALAQHRHFGRAARELGLSQPALSKNLRALEDELGAKLFHRDTGGASPTLAAEKIVSRGAGILADVEEIRLELDHLEKQPSGQLRFGVGPIFVQDPVGAALGHFIRDYPGVVLTLLVESQGELLRRLSLAEIDLFVAASPDPTEASGLKIRQLSSRRAFVYCRAGHPLVGRKAIDLSTLAQFTTLIPPLTSSARTEVEMVLNSLPDRKRFPVEIADIGLIHTILAASDAVAVGFGSAARAEFDSGELVTLPVALDGFARSTSNGAIVHRSDRPLSAAAAAFVEMIEAEDVASAQANPNWVTRDHTSEA